MITAENICEDLIRGLLIAETQWLKNCKTTTTNYGEYCQHTHAQYSARVALGLKRANRGDSRAKARARCVDILNALTPAADGQKEK